MKQLWSLWFIGSGHQESVGPLRLLRKIPNKVAPIMSKAKKVIECLEAALNSKDIIASDSCVADEIGKASNRVTKLEELYDQAYTIVGKKQKTGIALDLSFTTMYNDLHRRGLLG